MKLNRILSSLLAGAAALSLTACGPQPSSSASSTPPASSASQSLPADAVQSPFSLAIYPNLSLHPILSTNPANLTLAPLLYEPLFQVDKHFGAVPVLCQQYAVSEDRLTWTFTIRSTVSFSDGTPLTGRIVADALGLARSAGSRYAARLRDVASVSAEGHVVTVTLSRPNGRLPLLLDIPIPLGSDSRPLGTGPYTLTKQEDDLSLTVRPDWWQQKHTPADTIPLFSARKTEDLTYAFDSGDLSLTDVDLMGTNTPGYSVSNDIWDYPTPSMIYLGFNAQRGPCASGELRRALGQAIDREAIADTIYAQHAVAAQLPVHPASPLYDSALAARLAYNPQILRSLVENTSTASRELVFLVNSENTAKLSAAQLIAYQLEGAGVPVKLKKLSFDDYSAALRRGDFDLYLGEVILTADFDLSALLLPGGSLNYGGWLPPEAPALLAQLAMADFDQSPQAAKPLLQLLVENPPLTAVCFKNGSVLTQWGRLSGLSPIRGNPFYQLENWVMK